jgi:hypothetical protein
MPLFQGKNKRQMIRDPTPQKLDSFPDSPLATRPNSPFCTPSDKDNDHDSPVPPAQMNGQEQRFREPTLDVTDPLHPSILEKSPRLSKIFDESDPYQSDSFYEIDETER